MLLVSCLVAVAVALPIALPAADLTAEPFLADVFEDEERLPVTDLATSLPRLLVKLVTAAPRTAPKIPLATEDPPDLDFSRDALASSAALAYSAALASSSRAACSLCARSTSKALSLSITLS